MKLRSHLSVLNGHYKQIFQNKSFDLSNFLIVFLLQNRVVGTERRGKQAGSELGQAQLKLGLDFTLIFFRFGLSRFGHLVCGWIGR